MKRTLIRSGLRLASMMVASGLLSSGFSARADNPLVIPGNKSLPDVNLVPVGDVVYAFGGTDAEHLEKGQKFNMPYWRVFSSKDLVNWTLESELHPEDTYIGKTDQAWAGHGVFKNGKWYWYFSNHSTDTGVATADSIKGPWRDALGKPLLDEKMTKTREYDSCVFTDDDGRSYIVFGVNFAGRYHIAELNPDMISLKTEPKPIVNDLPKAGDGPFLHKYNGKYYLSSRTEYATADNINGPYTYRGTQDAGGHGGFFTWNNQWYVNFTKQLRSSERQLRGVALAYVNFRADGTIAPMEKEIRDYGVGRYDAKWDRIEAEWFFAMPDGPKKTETKAGGFEISNLRNGDYLRFPNINNCPKDPVIALTYSSADAKGGAISVREGDEKGRELGRATFAPTGSWTESRNVSIPLKNVPAGAVSLAFVIEGAAGQDLIHVDNFRVASPSL